MSMDICKSCGDLVDTDDDPDCYQPYPSHPLKGAPDVCICESCRERMEDEAAREPADREFSPAQQAIIDAYEDDDEEGSEP